jgi:hypothetical protein
MGFDPTKVGAFFRYTDATVALLAGTDKIVAQYNPYRVGLVISTLTINAFFRVNGAASSLAGFQLIANSNPLIISLESYGAWPQQEWHGFSTGGGNIWVQEILWQPGSE